MTRLVLSVRSSAFLDATSTTSVSSLNTRFRKKTALTTTATRTSTAPAIVRPIVVDGSPASEHGLHSSPCPP
eukprot:4225371-Prymnesium_polylepis.1